MKLNGGVNPLHGREADRLTRLRGRLLGFADEQRKPRSSVIFSGTKVNCQIHRN
jgi:ribosomal protein L18